MPQSFENFNFFIKNDGYQAKCLKFVCPNFGTTGVLTAQFWLEKSYNEPIGNNKQTFIFSGKDYEDKPVSITLSGNVEYNIFSGHWEVFNISFFELKIADDEKMYYNSENSILRIDNGINRLENQNRDLGI